MIFRKKYLLFYFLTFMGGARRQVFMAFAVFLLVKRCHFSLQEITILFVINDLINYFLSPTIGKSILRFGERKMLSLEYFSLIFIFLTYALIQSKLIISATVYPGPYPVQFRHCHPDLLPENRGPPRHCPQHGGGLHHQPHRRGVSASIGGLLWMVDYRIPFVAGAAMSLVSLIAVQQIRVSVMREKN